MKKFIKTFTMNPNDIEIHEVANMTPVMTDAEFRALKESVNELGQLEPVKMYRGRLVDGRHRLKALKELGSDMIIYENIDPSKSMSDLRELVTRGYESRRHQTPTQKAISAYYYMVGAKASGDKITQGQAAELFGVGRAQVARVKKLVDVASPDIVEHLFNGNKITLFDGRQTDNLLAVIKAFETHISKVLDESENTQVGELTDDESDYVKTVVDSLFLENNEMVMKSIADKIYVALNDRKQQGGA